jgi:hypothetical protein
LKRLTFGTNENYPKHDGFSTIAEFLNNKDLPFARGCFTGGHGAGTPKGGMFLLIFIVCR